MELLQTLELAGQNLLGAAWLPLWTLAKIVAIVAPLMISVAYLTLAARKQAMTCMGHRAERTARR